MLKERGRGGRFCFVVTLPDEGGVVDEFWNRTRLLNVVDMMENVGRLSIVDCAEWYARSDVVFLPTLLETFSATYLEAMAMGRPIVTTNLDFAREVCGPAALYYEPLSVQEAADAIERVANDERAWKELVQKGRRRLASFPSPEEKHDKVMDWVREVWQRSKQ